MAANPVPNLASPAFKADPHPFYRRLRAETPVCALPPIDRQPAWLVTRYADAHQLLNDDRLAKDRQNAPPPGGKASASWVPGPFRPLTRNMLDLDPPDHTRLRALVNKAFTPRQIERLRERIERLTHDLLDAAERRGRLDLIADFALPLPVAVIGDMLGIPRADGARFRKWSDRIIAVSSGVEGVLAIPTLWAFTRYVRGLLRARRVAPGDDLVSALIAVEETGDQLTEDELLAMVFLLLIAGYETTVNLIGVGTLALLQHPAELARFRAEPDLTRSAVEELLRFVSPIDLATERFAREPITVESVTIPQGGLVLIAIGSANRDERQFPDPDRLDLARQPNRHLAFGHGRHFCLGAPLARLEAGIALRALVERFPTLRLTVPAETLRWRKSLFLRGLTQLPLAW